MKKSLLMLALFLCCFLIFGCEDSSSESEDPQNEGVKFTARVGDVVLERNNSTFVYGGIVGNSVVINSIQNPGSTISYVTQIFIPVVSDAVELPNVSRTIEVQGYNLNRNEANLVIKRTE